MIRLNRTTEYGLMALRHMSLKNNQTPGEVTSAREIADCYGLPFEITAKTLQRLKDTGLIQSAHGARGGYTLQRHLAGISLGEFLSQMEGPQTVVACAGPKTEAQTASSSSPDCEYGTRCEIHGFMSQINSKLLAFLSSIPLSELTETQLSSSLRFDHSAGQANDDLTQAAPIGQSDGCLSGNCCSKSTRAHGEPQKCKVELK